MQQYANLVNLVKSFPTNIYLVLAKFGVDTAENEPLKVHLIFQPWDSIFTEPPRPASYCKHSGKRAGLELLPDALDSSPA